MAVNLDSTWALRAERSLMPLPVHSVPSLALMSFKTLIAAEEGFIRLAENVAANVRNPPDIVSFAQAIEEDVGRFREIFRETLQDPTLANLNTPLLRAAREGHINGVIMALEKGADVNLADAYEWAALMHAAIGDHKETAALLIEKGADVNLADEYEETALMNAAERDYIEMAALLIESGADVNLADAYEWTALIHAARGGHIKMIELLIESGADVNSADIYGDTALMHAAERGYRDIEEMLRRNS
ncbi:MAG: hypothetical protein A3F40_00255 [Chlamydiae bacterium RIFCSPHIGHO2_12_FULL_27_8]|nr:MAG: hypothetical protein A3F40_00255 [Chlamydiae bacterium RIFCSPHIGHO2_12_FULL_27_8]